jgi:hypothetical protein
MAGVAFILLAMLALLAVFAFQVFEVVQGLAEDAADCQYDIDYDDCSRTCGDGIKTGTVTITKEASTGGECLYEHGEVVTQACNLGDCYQSGGGNNGDDGNDGGQTFSNPLDVFDPKIDSEGVCTDIGDTFYGISFDTIDDANDSIAKECLCNDDFFCQGFFYFYDSSTDTADVTLCKNRSLNGQESNNDYNISRNMFLKNNMDGGVTFADTICNGYTSFVGEADDSDEEEDDDVEKTDLDDFTPNKSYCKPKLSAQCAAAYFIQFDDNEYHKWIDSDTFTDAEKSDFDTDYYGEIYARARMFDSTRNKCGGGESTELCQELRNDKGYFIQKVPLTTVDNVMQLEYAAGCKEFGPQLGDRRDYKVFPEANSRKELEEHAATACLKDPDCKGFFYNNEQNSANNTPVFFCEDDPPVNPTEDQKSYMANFTDNDINEITMYGRKSTATGYDNVQKQQSYVDTHYANGSTCVVSSLPPFTRCDASRMSLSNWQTKYYPSGNHVKANGAPDRYQINEHAELDDKQPGFSKTWKERIQHLIDSEVTGLNGICGATRNDATLPTWCVKNGYDCFGDAPNFWTCNTKETCRKASKGCPDKEGGRLFATGSTQKRVLYEEDKLYCNKNTVSGRRVMLNEYNVLVDEFDSLDDMLHTAAIACSNRENCAGFKHDGFTTSGENEVQLCDEVGSTTGNKPTELQLIFCRNQEDPKTSYCEAILKRDAEGLGNIYKKNTLCQDTLDDLFPDDSYMRGPGDARWWCHVHGGYPNMGTDNCNDAMKACNTPCAETLRTMVENPDSLEAFDFGVWKHDEARQDLYDWAVGKDGYVANTLQAMCI